MSTLVIYAIDCLVSGKSYIGRTSDPVRRKREHFTSLCRGNHKNQHLQNAFTKYGEENFVWRVVIECSTEAALRREEQYFLDKLWNLDCLFNLARSSDGGGHAGRTVSDQTRARMSAARKAYLADPAVRANLSAKHKGKCISQEQRAKLSAAHTGKKLSAEHRAAMSASQKRAWAARKAAA